MTDCAGAETKGTWHLCQACPPSRVRTRRGGGVSACKYACASVCLLSTVLYGKGEARGRLEDAPGSRSCQTSAIGLSKRIRRGSRCRPVECLPWCTWSLPCHCQTFQALPGPACVHLHPKLQVGKPQQQTNDKLWRVGMALRSFPLLWMPHLCAC